MNNKILTFTIIILVVSIISVILLQLMDPLTVQDISPKENLQIADSEIWYEAGFTSAQASVLIHNSENMPATIRQITIRGITCEWSNVYYWRGELGSVATLGPALNALSGTSFKAVIDGSERTFQQATGEIELDAYETLVLYIKKAGNITPENVPSKNATIAVYTETSVYLYQAPVTVEAEAIPFMGTEEIRITNAEFPGTGGVELTLRNTGSTSVTITEAYAGGDNIWSGTLEIPAGGIEYVTDSSGVYTAGVSYQFKVVSSKGNPFVYTATAPA